MLLVIIDILTCAVFLLIGNRKTKVRKGKVVPDYNTGFLVSIEMMRNLPLFLTHVLFFCIVFFIIIDMYY